MKGMKDFSFPRFLGILLFAGFLFCACSFKNVENNEPLPENFNEWSDSTKISFVMKRVSPDSTARFLCLAALGRLPEAKIVSFKDAVGHVYMAYEDSAKIVFYNEINDFPTKLPLEDKLRLYVMAGDGKPGRLGYRLGKEYAAGLHSGNITETEVLEEINVIENLLGDNKTDREKFKAGLKTSLSQGGLEYTILIDK